MKYLNQAKHEAECINFTALEEAVEALSGTGAIELPYPQLTLLHDYNQPLERYDDYEDDEGELRAESNLEEKFGETY